MFWVVVGLNTQTTQKCNPRCSPQQCDAADIHLTNTQTHTYTQAKAKVLHFTIITQHRSPCSLWSCVLPPVLHLTVCWAARRCVASAALRDQTTQLTHGQLSRLPPLISHLRRGKVKTREGARRSDGTKEMGRKRRKAGVCIYRRMADVKVLYPHSSGKLTCAQFLRKVNNSSHSLHFIWLLLFFSFSLVVNLYPQQL